MITDNDFSDVELDSALTAKPELLDRVKAAIEKRDYAFLPKSTIADLETQHIGKFIGTYAPTLEKYLKDTTGIDKEAPTEKYTAYNERVVKTLAEKSRALETEIATLKGTSNLTELERKQLEAAIEKNKAYEKQIKDVEANAATSISKAKMENKITQQMSTVTGKLLKDQKPGFQKAMEIMSNQIYQDISNAAEEVGGKIVLKGADGNALTNKDGSFKSVAQYYEEQMLEAGFVDDGKQQPGAGGGGKDSIDIKNIPGGAKTQNELLNWLRDNTMKGKSTIELTKEFDKYAHLLLS